MPEELLLSWNQAPDTRFSSDMLNSWDPAKRAVVFALSSLANFVRGESDSFGAAMTTSSESSFLRALVALQISTAEEARLVRDAEPDKPMTVFAGRLISGRTFDIIRTGHPELDVVLYHAEEPMAVDSAMLTTDTFEDLNSDSIKPVANFS